MLNFKIPLIDFEKVKNMKLRKSQKYETLLPELRSN